MLLGVLDTEREPGLVASAALALARAARDQDAPVRSEVQRALEDAYRAEPFIEVLPAGDPPEVKAIVGSHGVRVGGLQVHGTRAVLVATIDNLLKGAASQAVQNLNLSLGFPEPTGLRTIK